MAKIKNVFKNIYYILFRKIWVRAIPPFSCLKPGLDINRSRHEPVIRNNMPLSYINLSPK